MADRFKLNDTQAETASLRTAHIEALTGLTHRQLDWWSRISWLPPDWEGVGHGNYRGYSLHNLVQLAQAKLLLDLGFTFEKTQEIINQKHPQTPTLTDKEPT